MKINLLTTFFIINSYCLFAQSTDTTKFQKLTVYKGGGLSYYQGKEQVSFKKIGRIVETNPEALKYWRSAAGNRFLSWLLVCGGSYVIYNANRNQIVYKRGGGIDIRNPIPRYMVGLGLCSISIVMNVKKRKNVVRAVNIYNKNPFPNQSLSFQASFSTNRMGLNLSF
jgi:hypothetical protein